MARGLQPPAGGTREEHGALRGRGERGRQGPRPGAPPHPNAHAFDLVSGGKNAAKKGHTCHQASGRSCGAAAVSIRGTGGPFPGGPASGAPPGASS